MKLMPFKIGRFLTFLKGILLSLPATTPYELWRREFMAKRLKIVMSIALLCMFTFLGLTFVSSPLLRSEPQIFFWSQGISIVFCSITFIILLIQKQPRYLGFLFLFFGWSVTLIPQITSPWCDCHGPYFMGWILVFVTQATLIPVLWKLHFISHLVPFVYLFFFPQTQVNSAVFDSFNVMTIQELYLGLFWVSCICNISVSLYECLAKAEFRARHNLQLEQERAERLLLNILPPSIAQRLKSSEQTIAETFTEVTVLFADIVGFTKLSTEISATELVELLNNIFSRFDRLLEQHQLEKIKTIGDAYMVVAGLPEPREDHAEAIANMALDMQQTLQEFNQQTGQNLDLRIGFHTGAVVAGVIGLKKFAYDLWGDTVNTASRMESHSLPGYIQVSQISYELLKDRYLFKERGTIPIKGKGEMTTYLLAGKKV